MLVTVLSLNACWGFTLSVAISCVLGQWILHVFPQCAEEQKLCSRWLPGCCSCTQDSRFHQVFHWFSTESFHICSLKETFRRKELESASLLLGMHEVSLEPLGKPRLRTFHECLRYSHICHRPLEQHLHMLETSQHSIPFTGLSKLSLIHKCTYMFLTVLRGPHNLNSFLLLEI